MGVAVAVFFDADPLHAATTAVPQSDQKRRLSERSEFPPLPVSGAGDAAPSTGTQIRSDGNGNGVCPPLPGACAAEEPRLQCARNRSIF
jgi:hypothetical protein